MNEEDLARLAELWQERDALNKAEWAQLYQLVRRVLKQSHYSELESLPLSIENYIDEFFRDKVFMPTTKKNFANRELSYGSVLRTFFRRYLLDRIEEIQRRKRHEVAMESENGNDEDGEKLSIEDIKPAPPVEDDLRQLEEVGLKLKQVKLSACRFLQRSEEWVRIYLALHTCPDNDRRLPLNRLAQSYRIPAYHYRATQLGITGRNKNTLLGQWLISLGLTITSENRKVIEVVLKILCWEALSLAEQDAL